MPRPPLSSDDAVATALAIASLHKDELPDDTDDAQPDPEVVLAAVLASVGIPYVPSDQED